LYSNRNNLSPVIDASRCSVIGISNVIDDNKGDAEWITAGEFVVGKVYTIVTSGTTDYTLIGSANSNVDTVFTATGVGTGTGTAKEDGSALAKYVTKTVQLDSESNVLKVFLDMNRPQSTAIDVYYKVGSDGGLFDDGAWKVMTATVPYSDDPDVFKEVEYTHDFSDDSTATQFTMFAIKIVFTSSTTARVPSVRNLRAIALV